MAYAIATFVIQ